MKAVRLAFIIAVLALAVFFFSSNEADPDLWGHLKFGQDIFERLAVPQYDSYSYAASGARWINHEWLSELLFYGIFSVAGGAGLIVLKVVVGLLITFLIYASVTRATDSISLRALIIGACLSVVSYGFAVRPQIFTYLFFAGVVFCLAEYGQTGRPLRLWCLPVIFLLWCNLHGGFVAGIGILALYALCKIFDRKAAGVLIPLTAVSVIATLVNPYGIGMWGFLAESIGKTRPYIPEWGAVAFSGLFADYFVVVLFAALGVLFTKAKRSAFETVALCIGLILSLRHNRHIPLFAILVAFYIPRYAGSFAADALKRLEGRCPQKLVTAFFVCVALLSAVCALDRGKTNPVAIEIPASRYPVNAVAFMKDNKIGGNIFCWFEWAEMCMREMPGSSKVFLDGRYETVYGDDLIRGYFDVLYCKRSYKEYLREFPETGVMLLHRENPLANALLRDPDWTLVFSSGPACVYVKDTAGNRGVLEDLANNRLAYNQKDPPYYLR